MPVAICITSTNAASEPKKYQKLKFLGAMYLPHWLSHSAVSGKRSSIQVMNLLLIDRSVASRLLRILADDDARVARVPVRRDVEIRRRGNALEHAPGEVELRLVARTEEAAEPVRTEVGGRHLGPVGRRAAEVGADADRDPHVGLARAVLVLAVSGLVRDLGVRICNAR